MLSSKPWGACTTTREALFFWVLTVCVFGTRWWQARAGPAPWRQRLVRSLLPLNDPSRQWQTQLLSLEPRSLHLCYAIHELFDSEIKAIAEMVRDRSLLIVKATDISTENQMTSSYAYVCKCWGHWITLDRDSTITWVHITHNTSSPPNRYFLTFSPSSLSRLLFVIYILSLV